MRAAPFTAALSLLAGLLALAPTGTAVVQVEGPVRISGAGAVPGTAGIAHHRAATAADGYAVAAWLEAVPAGGDQLMARTRQPGGAWSEAVQVSSTTTGIGVASVSAFSLAVNHDGDAALAWRQGDTFGDDPETMAFAATLDRGDAAWSAARVGGQEHGIATFHAPAVQVLPDSTAVVGWSGYADEQHDVRQVYVNEGDEAGWGTAISISDLGGPPTNCLPEESGCEQGDVTDLTMAADGTGEVRAFMTGQAKVSNGSGGTTTRLWILKNTRDAGGGWSSAATPVTSVQDPYVAPSSRAVAGDRSAAGFVVGWSVPATEALPAGVHLEADGVARTFRHPTSAFNLSGVSLAGGHAAAMLLHSDGGQSHLGVVHLDPGDEQWSDPSNPAAGENLSAGPTASLAAGPDGRVTVMWGLGIPRRLYLTQRAPGATAWDYPRRLTLSEASQALPSYGVADDGSGTVAWREQVEGTPAVFAAGFAPEAVDPTPPTLTMTSPTKLLTRTPSWTVSWLATDQGGGTGTVTVAESEVAWDEAVPSTPASQEFAPGETSYAVDVAPGGGGTTSCYAARGFPDGSDAAGEWSAARCTATPVDDRVLKRVGSDWKRKSGAGRWDGTYLQTKRKGATLKLGGVRASHIGLLLERGKGFGRLKVVFDGVPLGTVDLAGKAKKRVAVLLEDFPTVRQGTLVVKVVSAGKVVRVDGVYAAQPRVDLFSD